MSRSSNPATAADEVLSAARERLFAAVDGIERGEFPAAPARSDHLHVVRVRDRVPQGLRGP